jgi:hypothetical protein
LRLVWKLYGCFLKWWYPIKSSILIGFTIINHLFLGTTISGNPRIYIAFNLGLPAQAVTCDVCQRWLVQMQQIEPQGLSQKDFFGVSIVMGVPQQLDGLFHGKS